MSFARRASRSTRRTLEGELSTVLEMVMSSRAADPALAIAKLLTERRQAALARPAAADIDAAIAALGEYKSAFSGQLAPPAPSAAELAAAPRSVRRPVQTLGGVVLQRGPYGGLWLRVGCVAEVAATLAWPAAQAVASHVLARARERNAAAACTSRWRRARSRRSSRRGSSGAASSGTAGGRRRAARRPSSCTRAGAVAARASSRRGRRRSRARRRWRCRPTRAVLLVWERSARNTPGGAVNPGELKLDTLAREVMEELTAAVDPPSCRSTSAGGSRRTRATAR